MRLLHLRWSRLTLVVIVVGAHVAWVGQGPAAAHSPISTIVLEVSASGGDVAVDASIRYPDNDPVKGETVVGVAYSQELQESRPVALQEAPGGRGRWNARLHVPAGRWQVEVDAIRKSRGLQSIGFVVRDDGTVSDVASPSPLPATITVPGAPAEAAGSGLREAPRTSATRTQLTWAVLMGVAGLLVMLVIVRRMAVTTAKDDREGPLGPGNLH